ncbi:MAG: DUF6644 family protein [Sphingorhabdus sp.]
MSIEVFSEWLYATSFSTGLRETTWAIPTIQSIHIFAISIIIGSALVTELRLAGMFAVDRAVPDVLRRYLPWMGRALAILLLTGLLLVVAEPGRTIGNTVFWIKMALVVGASVVTLKAREPLLRENIVVEGDELAFEGEDRAEASKLLAWFMVLVWCAIVFCGRFIAYT